MLALAVPLSAAAQSFETVGTRALGMGGAFVAVADDATGTYWNPAGLATGGVVSAVVEADRLRAVDGESGTSGLLALGTWPLGLTAYRLAGPRLTTTYVGVNVLQTLIDHVHVGATVKYVRGAVEDLAGIGTRGANRFDVDAGAIADFRRIKLGLTVRNLLAPSFDAPDGTDVTLRRQARAGIALKATDSLLVSVDADLTTNRVPGVEDPAADSRSVAAGVEQRFWQDRAAVRAGFRTSTVGDARSVGTFGGSLAVRSGMFLDGYAAIGVTDAAPDAFGLGLRFTY